MCIFESRLLNLYKPSHKHIGVLESTPQLPNTKKDKKRQKKYIGFFRFWLVFSTTQKLWKQSSGSFFPCLGIRASRVHLLCGTEELLEGNRLGVQPGLPEATLPSFAFCFLSPTRRFSFFLFFLLFFSWFSEGAAAAGCFGERSLGERGFGERSLGERGFGL